MREWDAERVAAAAAAGLLASGPERGPERVVIDSRHAGPGDLFVGLPGSSANGGSFAAAALAAGAWGVIATPEHLEPLVASGHAGALLASADPLGALGRLAASWRRELGAAVVAVTGSTGKTSTKDILAALLARTLRTVASPLNRNTEIGLPLAILAAPPGTQALVLELAMRGAGQIALLTEICAPDVGLIVNVGPAHVELLGSLEAIAAAKAELIEGLRPGATAVLRAHEPLLEPHLREDIEMIRFGEGGDVFVVADGRERRGRVGARPARDARARLSLCSTCSRTCVRPSPRRTRSASRSPTGRSRSPSRACAASASHCPAGCSSSTTATTPTRCRCAPRCRS